MQAAAALLAQGVSPRLLADDGPAPLNAPSAARPQSEAKCISFSGILEDTQWCQHSCGAPVPDCPRNFCQCENALPAKLLDSLGYAAAGSCKAPRLGGLLFYEPRPSPR